MRYIKQAYAAPVKSDKAFTKALAMLTGLKSYEKRGIKCRNPKEFKLIKKIARKMKIDIKVSGLTVWKWGKSGQHSKRKKPDSNVTFLAGNKRAITSAKNLEKARAALALKRAGGNA